jgi:hypothetical protein
MQKKILSHDPEMGITQWFIPESDGKSFVIQTSQNVSGIIEENKQAYTKFDERSNWKGTWHKVASIPLDLFFRLKKQGVVEDDAKFKRWLNSSEQRFLRTRPGRV